MLIAIGIDCDGGTLGSGGRSHQSREPLELAGLPAGLKACRLHGVEFVVADDSAGLRAALRGVLAEAAYQRCCVLS